MATTYPTLVGLYNETIQKINRNAGEWLAFLDSVCRNYKLSFDDLVLIYAQRPDATALMTFEQWTERYVRNIRSGSTGIAIFDKARQGRYLKYFFDISDTKTGQYSKPIPLWEMQPEYEQAAIKSLEISYGELTEKNNLPAAILSAAENAAEDHMQSYMEELQFSRENSLIEELDAQNVEVMFRRLLTNSVAYMIMRRCGIDAGRYLDEVDFDGLPELNTQEPINILGTATRDIAGIGLREIGRTVSAYQSRISAARRTVAEIPQNVHNDTE